MAPQPGIPPLAPSAELTHGSGAGDVPGAPGERVGPDPGAKPPRQAVTAGAGLGRAQLAAVATAGFLVLLKGVAAWLTNSLALGAAALDSAVDVFVSSASYSVLLWAGALLGVDSA